MGDIRKSKYVGGEMDEQEVLSDSDRELADEVRRENRVKLIVAVAAVVIALAAVTIYLIVSPQVKGKNTSKKLVETYMEGLAEADSDKVCSVMDPDTVSSDSSSSLIDVFKTYEDNGITYEVDYEMEDGRTAEDEDLQAVCNTIYGSSAEEAGVTRGYIIPISGNIIMTYQNQSSPYELDMEIVCYEKGGTWYLGGSLEDSE